VNVTGIEAGTRSRAFADGAAASVRGNLRVLSLSCVYPNAAEPNLGVFVRSRLRHLAELADVKVVAPVPQIDYARSRISWRGVPRREWDGPIEILRPAWLYPPGGYTANSLFLFARLLPLAAGVRARYDFDIIDAHFAFPDGIAASLLGCALKAPFAVTLRGNETMHAQYSQRRKLMAWSLRRAAAVIALSEELRQFALSLGVANERIRVIPNGIEAGIFYPRDRALCRRKHGVPAEAKVVVSAGSLIERKGHHRVIQALAQLVEKGLNAQLLIVGGAGREGRYEDQLRSRVADLRLGDRVRFTGEVSPEELAELMSASDVFCLASSREGWPNVVHEALSCGLPVVATRVGAIPDMIPSRDYGFAVAVGDALALECALEEALRIDWDRRKICARAQARTWSQSAQEVYAFLRERTPPARAGKGAR